MKRDAAVEQYLMAAQSWEIDRAARAQRAARVGWAVGIAGLAIGFLGAGAVYGLTPLKQLVPIVFRVDNSTGVVTYVPTKDGTAEAGWLETMGYLSRYVIARERYFYGIVEVDYEHTAAFNSPPLNQELIAYWDRNNPQSPLNRYKDGTTVSVKVLAVTQLKYGNGKDNLAQVRFRSASRVGGTGPEQVTHWIATIEYAYGQQPVDPEQRVINTVGFRVLTYRVDPEVVTAETKP